MANERDYYPNQLIYDFLSRIGDLPPQIWIPLTIAFFACPAAFCALASHLP